MLKVQLGAAANRGPRMLLKTVGRAANARYEKWASNTSGRRETAGKG